MMNVEKCLELLLAAAQPLNETEYVELDECVGRIAAEDVKALLPSPPFSRAAMDGYAVKAADTAEAESGGEISLEVAGKITAGEWKDMPYRQAGAIKVTTGAYIPEGYDAVIKQEDTDMGEETVVVRRAVKPGENYCEAGEDMKAGEVVIEKGQTMDWLSCGLLASIGEKGMEAVRKPKVTIISTGDELVEPGEELTPGKIYAGVGHMLAASARSCGIEVAGPYLCPDDMSEAQRYIEEAAGFSDMVITTGAVSVGEKDFIPALMKKMKAKELFRGADIQPGTPTMASLYDGKIILSLSGNPYAALANFQLYFWDVMAKMTGCDQLKPATARMVMAGKYDKVNKHRRLIRAKAEGMTVQIPEDVHYSSVISNLKKCNCFIDLEAGRTLTEGDIVNVRYIKGL